MKFYDVYKLIETVEVRGDELVSVSLGMAEDWSWTAVTQWNKEKGWIDGASRISSGGKLEVAGIVGSAWATPSLELNFLDGHSELIDCYFEENEQLSATQERLDKILPYCTRWEECKDESF